MKYMLIISIFVDVLTLVFNITSIHEHSNPYVMQGRIQGAPGAPPPLTLEKKYDFFWRKIVIFHTQYPKSAPPNLKSWIRPCYG